MASIDVNTYTFFFVFFLSSLVTKIFEVRDRLLLCVYRKMFDPKINSIGYKSIDVINVSDLHVHALYV